MKKILLTTTSIGLMVLAGSAFAEMPKATIGGEIDAHVSFSSQESEFESNFLLDSGAGSTELPYSKEYHTALDTSLFIKVEGKSDSGLGYGAYIDLNADVNKDYGFDGNRNAEETYFYVEADSIGKFKVGAMYSSAYNMSIDASNIARAAGGIRGPFYRYVDLTDDSNQTSGTVGDTPTDAPATLDDVKRVSETVFLVTPELPASAFPQIFEFNNNHENAIANKITYVSPSISGFQAGLSYTPDLSELGTSDSLVAEDTSEGFENIFDYAVSYDTDYEGFQIKVAFTGEFGKAKNDKIYDDLSAFSIGGVVDYQGFSFAGSYLRSSEFGQLSALDTKYNLFTAGVSYVNGPLGVSFTGLRSKVENGGRINVHNLTEITCATPGACTSAEILTSLNNGGEFIPNAEDNKFLSASLGIDYQFAEGVAPYAEVTYFDTDDNVSATKDNSGYVFLVGAKIDF